MPLWNVANSDFTLVLDVEAFDDGPQDGNMVGTIIYQGTLYSVHGGWAASGPGRAASAFYLVGWSNADQPNYIAATGIMTGPGNAPIQVDLRMGFAASSDGNLSEYDEVLLPYIVRINGPQAHPYQSGEISLQSMTARQPAALANFNDNLFVWSFGQMATFDLRNLIKSDTDHSDSEINTEALQDLAKWTMQSPLAQVSGFMYEYNSRNSLAATPDALYLFVMGLSAGFQSRLAALSYSVDPSSHEGKWLDHATVLGTSQAEQPLQTSNVRRCDNSTTVLGDNIVIFTATPVFEDSNNRTGTYLGIYDTRDFPQKGDLWNATWHRFLPMNGYAVDSVTTEWFSTVGDDGKPEFYLAVYAPVLSTSAQPTGQMLVWYIPLTVTQDDKGGTVVVPAEPASPRVMNPQVGEGDLIRTLVRDPAGRVRAWGSLQTAASGAGLLTGHILETLNSPAATGDPICPRVKERVAASDTFVGPSSLFYMFAPGQSQTTVNNRPGIEYPVYEFVFYGQNIKFQMNRYGSIQQFTDYGVGTPKQKPDSVKYIIGGIIDGPIPLPIENYRDYNLGETEKVAGTVTYGSSNTKITSREVSNKWTVGFKSSGKATKGVGVAWDISLKGGMGSVSEDSVESSLESGLNISAKVTGQQGETPASINQNGTLLELAVQFSITAYRFLDRFGKLISDATTGDPGESQKAATISTTLQAAGSLPYTPFMVTPGNLMSYTPEALNKTMHSLGYRGENIPDDQIANYYGDVIYANAYPFAENTPYLEFSWSQDSETGQGYTQFTSAYTENSWSLDGEFYVGISMGLGFSVFGLGEEEEMEFMVGASYSHESTQSQNKESEWSISLDEDWGPPAREEMPKTVAAYDFRLFFLPVPKAPSKLEPSHWAQELKQYLNPKSETKSDEIDVNSGCWRIVYVVTNIQYQDDDANSYQYRNNYLDTMSVYQT